MKKIQVITNVDEDMEKWRFSYILVSARCLEKTVWQFLRI